jgi:hypothetical protein
MYAAPQIGQIRVRLHVLPQLFDPVHRDLAYAAERIAIAAEEFRMVNSHIDLLLIVM